LFKKLKHVWWVAAAEVVASEPSVFGRWFSNCKKILLFFFVHAFSVKILHCILKRLLHQPKHAQ